jgi:hypothetical protein
MALEKISIGNSKKHIQNQRIMDKDTILIIGRIAERLVILLCSVYVVNLGAKLLINGAGGKASIDIKTLAGKFKLTNAAAGLVVILLGIISFYIAIESKLKINDSESGSDRTEISAGTSNVDSTRRTNPVAAPVSANEDTGKAGNKATSQKTVSTQQSTRTVSTSTTQKKHEIIYSDPGTANYVGPKVTLDDVQSLYTVTYQLCKQTDLDVELKKKLLDIYQHIYVANMLTEEDQRLLTKLSEKSSLTPAEAIVKAKLKNKLSSEYDYRRIAR